MHTTRRWSSPPVIALSILCLSAGRCHANRGEPNREPQFGSASGVWELPEFPAGGGIVTGSLDSDTGGPALYTFQACLLDSGAMCPACIIGEIHGTLDDGIGPSPDFLVDGGFGGDFPRGAGSFSAGVKRPSGRQVGSIRGQFIDFPGNPNAGLFLGRFQIED